MKQTRINGFFKALPEKLLDTAASVTFENSSESLNELPSGPFNDSDLIPGTPDTDATRKNFSRSFLSSNFTSIRHKVNEAPPSVRNVKVQNKVRRRLTKTTPSHPGINLTNAESLCIHESINMDIDSENSILDTPSAKRRDVKTTPEMKSEAKDISSKDINVDATSFKSIVNKYRMFPPKVSSMVASEKLEHDASLDDVIMEIHNNQHLVLQTDAQSKKDKIAVCDDACNKDMLEGEISIRQFCQTSKDCCEDKDLDEILKLIGKDEATTTPSTIRDHEICSSTSVTQKVNNVLYGQSSTKESDPPFFHRYGRHKVLSVLEMKGQVLLKLQCASTGLAKEALLTGCWTDTQVKERDWVNVIGRFDDQYRCTIGQHENLIVVDPDLLVTGTAVSSSTSCLRKVVLSDKFKYLSATMSHNLIYGTIIHAVFQEVLKNNVDSIEGIKVVVDEILKSPDLITAMYSQGVSESEIRGEIEKYLSQLKCFIDSYVKLNTEEAETTASTSQFHAHHHYNQANSFIRTPLAPLHQKFSNLHANQECFPNKGNCPDAIITDVIDIEENIWCPSMGIKGKVDVTARVRLHRKTGKQCRKVIPIELKTGRNSYSPDHMGQVMLYSLMMDRIAKEEYQHTDCLSWSGDHDDDDNDIGGLLVYLKHSSSKFISTTRAAICGLVMLRNRLAFYLNENSKRSSYQTGDGGLPDVVYNKKACGFCDQRLNCCLYQRCFEKNVLSEDHPMREILPVTLSHLNESHLKFFHRLCSALHLEEDTVKRKNGRNNYQDVWLKSAEHRVEEGLCLRNLTLKRTNTDSNKRFRADFKQNHSPAQESNWKIAFSFDDSISPGDRVMISHDGHLGGPPGRGSQRVAVAFGRLNAIHGDGLIEVDTESDLSRYTKKKIKLEGSDVVQLYRLDKVDSFTSLPLNLSNLSRLMADEPVSERLRSLVIDLKSPGFMETLPKSWIPKIRPYLKSSNRPQQSAIMKCLLCEDYVLIKGFPGTGKTTTITTLIQILTHLGFSVLLASYTHSAIDNVLIKLIEKGIDVLRLGKSENKVHPKVIPFLDNLLIKKSKSPEELKMFYDSKRVVATTCLGINHAILKNRKFDYCIVDEASQSLLLSCIGPLLSASKFILVGDPDQLPPIVQDAEARELMLGQSLFELLDGMGATFELTLQYRMNKEIVRLCNELMYKGRLMCGNDSVANAKLFIPERCQDLERLMDKLPHWLCSCFDPSKEVVWLDTSLFPEDSETARCEVANDEEASIVLATLALFLKAGLPTDHVGIISPFRSQVFHMRRKLSKSDLFPPCQVEVNTIDQYQGRDKEVILVTFAKRRREHYSNKDVNGTEILSDKRRLNVALSRGKFKVILVGDSSHLMSYEPFQILLRDILRPDQITTIENVNSINTALDLIRRNK